MHMPIYRLLAITSGAKNTAPTRQHPWDLALARTQKEGGPLTPAAKNIISGRPTSTNVAYSPPSIGGEASFAALKIISSAASASPEAILSLISQSRSRLTGMLWGDGGDEDGLEGRVVACAEGQHGES